MAEDSEGAARSGPSPQALCAYVEDMLLEFSEMATGCGETALAAALGLVAIQAGISARRPPSGAADQAPREEFGPAGQG